MQAGGGAVEPAAAPGKGRPDEWAAQGQPVCREKEQKGRDGFGRTRIPRLGYPRQHFKRAGHAPHESPAPEASLSPPVEAQDIRELVGEILAASLDGLLTAVAELFAQDSELVGHALVPEGDVS